MFPRLFLIIFYYGCFSFVTVPGPVCSYRRWVDRRNSPIFALPYSIFYVTSQALYNFFLLTSLYSVFLADAGCIGHGEVEGSQLSVMFLERKCRSGPKEHRNCVSEDARAHEMKRVCGHS